MEHNDEHIEDFFRKKLTEPTSNQDPWDLPSAGVWERTAAQFPSSPAAPSSLWSTIQIVALPALLILSISIAGYLFFRVQGLEKEVLALKKEREIAPTSHSYSSDYLLNPPMSPQASISSGPATKKHTSPVDHPKIHLPIGHTNSEQGQKPSFPSNMVDDPFQGNRPQAYQGEHAPIHRSSISSFSKDRPIEELTVQMPSSDREAQTIASQGTTNPSSPRPAVQTLAFLPAGNLHSLIPPRQPLFLPELNFLPISRKKPSRSWGVEAGYDLHLAVLNIPSIMAFEDLKSTTDNESIHRYHVVLHGGHVGIFLQKNWLIQLGVQRGTFTTEDYFSAGLVYHKQVEQITDDGEKTSYFNVLVADPFLQDEALLESDVAVESDLNTGDLLFYELSRTQEIGFTQIPLRSSVFLGKDAWKGFLTTGLQWNQLSYNHATTYASFTSIHGDKLEEDDSEFEKDLNVKEVFWTASAGVGIQYQWSNRWSARTSLLYQYQLSPHKKDQPEMPRLQPAYQLGIQYQF